MKAVGCKKCPTEAKECYLDKIFLHKGNKIQLFLFFYQIHNIGYWKAHAYSENIYYCNNFEEKCLGGLSSTCEDGYAGALCSQCKWGYSRFGASTCIECKNSIINVLSIIGMFILLLFIMGIFIV